MSFKTDSVAALIACLAVIAALAVMMMGCQIFINTGVMNKSVTAEIDNTSEAQAERVIKGTVKGSMGRASEVQW